MPVPQAANEVDRTPAVPPSTEHREDDHEVAHLRLPKHVRGMHGERRERQDVEAQPHGDAAATPPAAAAAWRSCRLTRPEIASLP